MGPGGPWGPPPGDMGPGPPPGDMGPGPDGPMGPPPGDMGWTRWTRRTNGDLLQVTMGPGPDGPMGPPPGDMGPGQDQTDQWDLLQATWDQDQTDNGTSSR